jgi:hypothetical protein
LLHEDCFNGWKNLKDQNGADKTRHLGTCWQVKKQEKEKGETQKGAVKD